MRTAAIAPRTWATLTYLAGAGVVVLGALGGANHGVPRAGLFAGAAALAVLQLAAQQRRERASTDIAEETRTVTNNAISNAFTPLLGLVVALLEAPDDEQRATVRAQLRTSVAWAASYAIGPDQGVRSCVFDVDDAQHPTVLHWTGVHAGRADEPKSAFRSGTVRGDTALAMIADDGYEFCADTEATPPPGWDEDHPHTYRTFLAVPVRAGDRPIGMLTVDSLTAGDLEPDRDRPILLVLARILAVASVSASDPAQDGP